MTGPRPDHPATGTGHLQKGHGVAFADLHADGNQDVYANIGGFVPGDAYQKVVFRNPGHPGNHWIRLKLRGTKSNRDAVGALVTLRVGGRPQVRQVESASGYLAQSTKTLLFGLGDSAKADSCRLMYSPELSGLSMKVNSDRTDRESKPPV